MDECLSRCLCNIWIVSFVFSMVFKVALGSTSYSSDDKTLSLWATFAHATSCDVLVWSTLPNSYQYNVQGDNKIDLTSLLSSQVCSFFHIPAPSALVCGCQPMSLTLASGGRWGPTHPRGQVRWAFFSQFKCLSTHIKGLAMGIQRWIRQKSLPKESKTNSQMSDWPPAINAHESMFKYRRASAQPFLRWSVRGHEGNIWCLIRWRACCVDNRKG